MERYFRRRLKRQFDQMHPACCPQVLGRDEHFFTRRKGFATTICDLTNHKIYDPKRAVDAVIEASGASPLTFFIARLRGKARTTARRISRHRSATFNCSVMCPSRES